MLLNTLLQSIASFIDLLAKVTDPRLLHCELLLGLGDLAFQGIKDHLGGLVIIGQIFTLLNGIILILAVLKFELLQFTALLNIHSLSLAEILAFLAQLLLVELSLDRVIKELNGDVVD